MSEKALSLVLSDDELFEDAIAAEGNASESRWRAADDYAELTSRGYSSRDIGERVGKSHTHIQICLRCVTGNLGFQRGDFQTAYDAAKSTAHLSSEKDEWATPQDLFDELDAEFGFTLDVCATEANAKCAHFFSKDSLEREWTGVCWMNPPYSEIDAWVKKAYESGEAGATVVCLVPSRTDVAWTWEWARRGEVRFLRSRLHFVDDEDNTGPAPFPSAVLVFPREPRVIWWERNGSA